ncbi:kinetochore Sim4 complex subunit Fta4 [Chaetomidium leptoderma]|uniref:Kinetochore Sim4 complex subunit Fta4 n=1 Tax=Chaetomidium leptoderma TaxID=669021 RepID=A0AAN7A101_9PEZI|nr:kinetochore Sim4 complex subunit Fta4 [Chaetomidium leptoderma]
MAPTPPTVVSLKQSFLTTQTRLLSQPLAPTRAWQSSNNKNNKNNNNNNNNETSNENPAALPEKAIDDALFKLNHRLQQHARRVYAPQATRHVAEQIDQLYWNAAEAAAAAAAPHSSRGDAAEEEAGGTEEEDGIMEGGGLTLGADLADPNIIATLPLEWETTTTTTTTHPHPLETKRYAELAADLHALAERKRQAAARVARLRGMQPLLAPFSSDAAAASHHHPDGDGDGGGGNGGGGNGNGGGGVQENLVTRNGEVEAELNRMRMLLARVGGRVGQLREQQSGGGGGGRESSVGSLFSDQGGGGGPGVEDVEMDERRKVGLLLERF